MNNSNSHENISWIFLPSFYGKSRITMIWPSPEVKKPCCSVLYRARVRKAWHNERKAGHYSELAKFEETKMTVYCREVDAKYNASARAVSHPRPYARLISDVSFPLSPLTNSRSKPPCCSALWTTGAPLVPHSYVAVPAFRTAPTWSVFLPFLYHSLVGLRHIT